MAELDIKKLNICKNNTSRKIVFLSGTSSALALLCCSQAAYAQTSTGCCASTNDSRRTGSFRRGFTHTGHGTSTDVPATTPAAQEGLPVPANAPPDSSNDIIVTGSLIARPDYKSDSPIVSVSKDVLSNSGQATVERALTSLSAVLGRVRAEQHVQHRHRAERRTELCHASWPGLQAHAAAARRQASATVQPGRFGRPEHHPRSPDRQRRGNHWRRVHGLRFGRHRGCGELPSEARLLGPDAEHPIRDQQLRRRQLLPLQRHGRRALRRGPGPGDPVAWITPRDRAKRPSVPGSPTVCRRPATRGPRLGRVLSPTYPPSPRSIDLRGHVWPAARHHPDDDPVHRRRQIGFNRDGTIYTVNGAPVNNFREPQTDDAYLVTRAMHVRPRPADEVRLHGRRSSDRYAALFDVWSVRLRAHRRRRGLRPVQLYDVPADAIVNTTLSNNIYLQSVPYNNPFLPADFRSILASRANPTADFQFHKTFNAIGNADRATNTMSGRSWPA